MQFITSYKGVFFIYLHSPIYLVCMYRMLGQCEIAIIQVIFDTIHLLIFKWPQFGDIWPHLERKWPQFFREWPHLSLKWPLISDFNDFSRLDSCGNDKINVSICVREHSFSKTGHFSINNVISYNKLELF